eukprot:TRINITY_DN2688_c0_g1_i2.p1 TRINITY_DN2688_c0_g1~~TRINITY_DN2688_c0_g1_i2.p1  ORF type:complete len:471 (+),score=148.77 TRINITY_DN2688_c0_g1_i2:79-1491(+)
MLSTYITAAIHLDFQFSIDVMATRNQWKAISSSEVVDLQLAAESARKEVRELEIEILREEKMTKEIEEAIKTKEKLKDDELAPIVAAMEKLKGEEQFLRTQMSASDLKIVDEYLQQKEELDSKEFEILRELQSKEDELVAARQALCEVDVDRSGLSEEALLRLDLYLEWKRCLAEQEVIMRDVRREKYRLMTSIKTQNETQSVLADVERDERVKALQTEVERWTRKVNTAQNQTEKLETSIAKTKASLNKFKEEFEQLRVALLVDRMTKTSKFAALKERRRKLMEVEKAAEKLAASERKKIQDEASAEWNAVIDQERKLMEQELEEESKELNLKLDIVKDMLKKRYEEGFTPLIKAAEEKARIESERCLTLEKQIKEVKAKIEEEETAFVDQQSELSATTTQEDLNTESNISPEEQAEIASLKEQVLLLWDKLEISIEERLEFIKGLESSLPADQGLLIAYKNIIRKLSL